MLKKIIETIRTTTQTTEFWLTNETCNRLMEEAKSMRLSKEGIFEFNFDSGDIVGINKEGIVLYANSKKVAFVKIVYLNDEYKSDKFAKNCKIL